MVLNFLAAQAQKFAPRTIMFDKDRGSEIFLRALGGRYERITRGAVTGFNPLRLPDNAVNRAFLRDWLSGLVEASAEEEPVIGHGGGRIERLTRAAVWAEGPAKCAGCGVEGE